MLSRSRAEATATGAIRGWTTRDGVRHSETLSVREVSELGQNNAGWPRLVDPARHPAHEPSAHARLTAHPL